MLPRPFPSIPCADARSARAGRGLRLACLRCAGALQLAFLVAGVLPAEPAVLLLLQLVGSLLALVRRVVPVAALGADQEYIAFFDLHASNQFFINFLPFSVKIDSG